MSGRIPPPTDAERCIAVRHGERCKNYKMTGLTVCRHHGGGSRAAKAKSEKAKLVTQMHKFVAPIAADDPENHPIVAFEVEFRRTLGRIRWYDEQLAKLEVEDLTWGRTKEEEINASEFDGTNTTYETKANAIHELQFRERRHLLDMEKIWIGAKLDEKKLSIQREYVRMLDERIVAILTALGHDVHDPAIRQVVRDQLLALPVRGELEGAQR